MKESNRKYIKWGITAFIVIAASILFQYIIQNGKVVQNGIRNLSKPFYPIIYGIVIAYLLNPILRFCEEKCFYQLSHRIHKANEKKAKRFNRSISIFCTMLFALLLFSGLLWLVIPQIYISIRDIVGQKDSYVGNIEHWLEGLYTRWPMLEETIVKQMDGIYDKVIDWLSKSILPNLDTILVSVSNGVLGGVKVISNLIIGFIVAAYVMSSKDVFTAQSKKLLYSFVPIKQANKILDAIRHANQIFGGYINGKLIDSLIVGIVCFLGLSILRMPYAALISVIVGVTNIIPVFGPFIGAIPCALLLLVVSPMKCFIFIIFVVILQQVDGNILGPKILGNSTGLSSFWVLTAILVCGGLFGFMGMLIGVPIFACFYAGIRYVCNSILEKKRMPVQTSAYEKLVHMPLTQHTDKSKDNFEDIENTIEKEDSIIQSEEL